MPMWAPRLEDSMLLVSSHAGIRRARPGAERTRMASFRVRADRRGQCRRPGTWRTAYASKKEKIENAARRGLVNQPQTCRQDVGTFRSRKPC